jgi:hypothetical protein
MLPSIDELHPFQRRHSSKSILVIGLKRFRKVNRYLILQNLVMQMNIYMLDVFIVFY